MTQQEITKKFEETDSKIEIATKGMWYIHERLNSFYPNSHDQLLDMIKAGKLAAKIIELKRESMALVRAMK